MKKWKIILFILLIFTFVNSTGFAISNNTEISIIMDGKAYKVKEVPIVINGQAKHLEIPSLIHPIDNYTLVPLRFASEYYGAEVSWDQKTKTATILLNGKEIKTTINSKDVYINGQRKSLDGGVVPKTITFSNGDSRTMVPLRFISEAFGYEVGWDVENRLPFISTLAKKDIKNKVEDNTDIRKITNVKVEEVSDNPKVIIEGTKNLNYSKMFLENPNRLVIDIDDAILNIKNDMFDGGLGSIKVDSDLINKVSFSQFSIEPNTVRVVVNLPEKVYYSIIHINEGKSLEILFGEDVDIESEYDFRVNLKSSDILIAIDPGHGGNDPGAISKNGTKEKDIVLSMSQKLNEALNYKGYGTLMIRDGDYNVDKYERAKIANIFKVDIFVSIHANAVENNSNISGIEVLYYPTDTTNSNERNNYELAKIISEELISNLGVNDRGVIKRPKLVVLRNTKMPAILIETGFLTNPIEEELLKDEYYQNKMVESIVLGIERYFLTIKNK